MRCWNPGRTAASAIGGTTSARDAALDRHPDFTWYVRPATEPGTLASGAESTVRGEGRGKCNSLRRPFQTPRRPRPPPRDPFPALRPLRPRCHLHSAPRRHGQRLPAAARGGGSSTWIRRNADRSDRVRRATGPSRRPGGHPPGSRRSSPLPPPTLAIRPLLAPGSHARECERADDHHVQEHANAAPGPSRTPAQRQAKPGSGDGSGEGGFHGACGIPRHECRGAARCAPTPRRTARAAGYFLACSGA